MKAKKLYARLDRDFGVDNLRDDWSFMRFNNYITPSFKRRYMGVMLGNTGKIEKVYTAVFPDLDILDKLLATKEREILLFTHHAMGYDPTISGLPFYDIPEEYLQKLKKQRISLYTLHNPLDKNGEFSTSVNLAKNLGLELTGEFCEYDGMKVGILGKTELKSILELVERVKSTVGHEVRLLANGDHEIHEGRVAVAAGGGNLGFVVKEIADLGINTYITGCTREVPGFEPVDEFHRVISENKINVIGATHYSTEKFACIAMTGYFRQIGIPSAFLEGRYHFEDL
jgi:putative NIF3 family GTP cyclohydrolase 1 type 2